MICSCPFSPLLKMCYELVWRPVMKILKLILAWSKMDWFMQWCDDKSILCEDNHGDHIANFLWVLVWLLWILTIYQWFSVILFSLIHWEASSNKPSVIMSKFEHFHENSWWRQILALINVHTEKLISFYVGSIIEHQQWTGGQFWKWK